MGKISRSVFVALVGIPFILFFFHSSRTDTEYDSSSEKFLYVEDGSNIFGPGGGGGDGGGSISSSGSSNSNTVGTRNVIAERSISSQCNCDNNVHETIGGKHIQRQFKLNESLFSEHTLIFLITPTYTRPTQLPDMTRLAQTLALVPNIFWIVVEDSHTYSRPLNALLRRSGVPFAHLLGPRPIEHMDQRSGRGVSNRLKAFEWIRSNYDNSDQRGVIYFADDDNAYDARLFEEIRDTKIVSMFPVGLINVLGLSTPIVSNKTGKIIGFHDPFIGRRKFAVDMAGFSVNLQYFLNRKNATMPYKVGYEEDFFLKSLGVQINELEPKASNCTEILVWHTKTKPGDSPKMDKLKRVTKFEETNLPVLYDNVLQV